MINYYLQIAVVCFSIYVITQKGIDRNAVLGMLIIAAIPFLNVIIACILLSAFLDRK